MASTSVIVETSAYEWQLEAFTKWLSCNGELWGVGPTVVFGSAAALFLYKELTNTILDNRDDTQATRLEKSLISAMVLGFLALMIHLWVCSMRLFQYYLDSLIKDTPNVILEMTTGGLVGGQTALVPLMPLIPFTVFLKQQQPQIHITVCWFLSLCYADYVRKRYCQRYNVPYLEQWQLELQERTSRLVRQSVQQVSSFVGSVHQRLRGFLQTTQPVPPVCPAPACPPPTCPAQTCPPPACQSSRPTEIPVRRTSAVDIRAACSQVSWGPTGYSEDKTTVSPGLHKDLCIHLVTKPKDYTTDIQQLRTYISETRCACVNIPCNSEAATLRDEVLQVSLHNDVIPEDL